MMFRVIGSKDRFDMQAEVEITGSQLCLQGNGLSGMVGEAFSQAAQSQGYQVLNGITPGSNCDVFCHFAARHPYHSDQQILDSNVGLLAEMLAKIKPHTRLIFLSSNSVYEGCTGVVNEVQTIQPTSLYGVSKSSGEQLIRACHPNHIILRLPAVLGYRPSQHLLARWLHCAERNQPVTLMNPEAIFNNFITLESLVQVLLHSVSQQDLPSGIYNLGTLSRLSFATVFEKVIQAAPNQPEVQMGSSDVAPIQIDTSKAMQVYSGCLTVDDENLASWAKAYWSKVIDAKGGIK